MAKRFLKAAAGVLAVLFVVSCASAPGFQKAIDEAVLAHEFNAAIELICEAQEHEQHPLFDKNNSISLFLDLGVLHHFAGNHSESVRRLTEAERQIEDAWTQSITQGFLTFIANDDAQEYPGEDFEGICISVFNALNFFHMGTLKPQWSKSAT